MPWQNHGNRVISNFPSCCFCAISQIFCVCTLYLARFGSASSSFGVPSLPWIIRNSLELCGATSKLSAQAAAPSHLFVSVLLLYRSLSQLAFLSPATCRLRTVAKNANATYISQQKNYELKYHLILLLTFKNFIFEYVFCIKIYIFQKLRSFCLF